MRKVDIAGQVHGELHVLRPTEKRWCGRVIWRCKCSCGKYVDMAHCHILKYQHPSCGCRAVPNNYKHGHAVPKEGRRVSRTYASWAAMKNRCDDPKNEYYDGYGGRGIRYARRWATFENFLADMGECGKGLTIDRINKNGNYTKSNCRWADKRTQSNNRRNNIVLAFRGRRLTIGQWATELNMAYSCLYYRWQQGWLTKKILEVQ